MNTSSEAEMIGALFTANVVVLEGLIDQGVVDKTRLIKFIQTLVDDPQPDEPLNPALVRILSRLVAHLTQPMGQITLQ